ncbi:hypothetical protein E8E14_004087 [Neopestalotiopsis sp. 37M]|nr:hypothetical protein E8E14_004087 [Neopestalotiopsis sp. 37M]
MVDCVYQTQATAAAPTATASASISSQPDAMNLSSMESELSVLSNASATRTSPQSDSYTTYETTPPQNSTVSSSSPAAPDSDSIENELPESRERRIWELRLLHNSLTQAKPFPTPQPPVIHDLFLIDIPKMALNEGRDGVLYGTFAHSALNLWTRSSDPEEKETLIRLQRTYLSLMLRQHRRDVAVLNPDNADAVCIVSLKILTHALALIQTLPSDPWQPPIDFLRMGSGAGSVFHTALRMAQSASGGQVTKILTFVQTPPGLRDPAETIFSDHSELDWILETPPTTVASSSSSSLPEDAATAQQLDAEMSDPQTVSVYHKAIAFICSVQRAIARGEPEFAICRRLGGFAVLVPSEFTEYLIERRPRALVVLAHFMACFISVEHIWTIGQAGTNQITGILKNLPVEWSYKLDGLLTKYKKCEGIPPVFSGGHGALM